MSSAQPGIDWELGSYGSFSDWLSDFIHLSNAAYLTDVRLLFVLLAADMERLGQPTQDPEDDENERRAIQALENQWVKFDPPVSPLCRL